jgi:hypothetical protein
MKIFLSSTYTDLLAEREVIKNLCQELNTNFIGMEVFRSSSNNPLITSLNYLKQCDIAIFIIGHRYGSVDKKSSKSIVQLEYEAAVKQKKAIRTYLKDDKVSILLNQLDISTHQKQLDFRSSIKKNNTCKFFSNPDQLASLVILDIFEIFYNTGNRKINDYSIYEKNEKFWEDTVPNKEVNLITEVKRNQKTGVEEAKNINATLGLVALIPTLAERKISHSIQPARNGLALDCNTILDGSHLGNVMTDLVVRELDNRLIYKNFNSDDRSTRWIENTSEPRSRFDTRYTENNNGTRMLDYDFGFLARVRNPRSSHLRWVIASGNHGAGTYACMKLLSLPNLIADLYDKVGERDFQAVVGIQCGQVYQLGDPKIHDIKILRSR